MLTTTLNKIHKHNPCKSGWKQLLWSLNKTKADDESLSLEHILNSNDLIDALWALRAIDGHQKALCLYACSCARIVLNMYEEQYPNDKRVRQAIEAAEHFIYGKTTTEKLCAAIANAVAAANVAANVAANADAVHAAVAAAYAARTARAAVAAADADDADVAAYAAAAAGNAANVAQNNIREVLKEEFLKLCRLEGAYGEIESNIERAR